jgi:5-methylthioribose kinase
MTFVLSRETAAEWLVQQRLVEAEAVPELEIEELTGGVSATVLAVRGPATALVLKQALPELRVAELWQAKLERTDTEVAALRLCDRLTPGAVPRVVHHDPQAHVAALELLPAHSRNWQAEVADGRVNPEAGEWAGHTLGTWHQRTSGDSEIEQAFDDHEAFVQQRLDPFYKTTAQRLPEVAPLILRHHDELRDGRLCFVDGDFAMKNIHVGRGGPWAFDFEVSHYGNPLFDLGFFLSFVVLSAIHWPERAGELEALRTDFLRAYRAQAPYADDPVALAGHTACLILARTDGTSPAQFLDQDSRRRARDYGRTLLLDPTSTIWMVGR